MGSYSFATSWIQELSIFLCKSLSEYFNGDNEWENGESSCNLPHYGIIVPSVSTFQYLVWFLTHGVWLNILMGTWSSSKTVMTECDCPLFRCNNEGNQQAILKLKKISNNVLHTLLPGRRIVLGCKVGFRRKQQYIFDDSGKTRT